MTQKIKAILFCRVSSAKQDYQRQISDLMPLALADGYKEDEIHIIAHKESATKNDVANRKTIAELTEMVGSQPIETVYCTELSRLARRHDVYYSVMSLLSNRNICLVVQQPMLIRTINKDGSKNSIADIIIAFLSHLAVSESEIKVERQKSGYAQKLKEGKCLSSNVIYGYKRDKAGFAVIDNEAASNVIDIFNLYKEGFSLSSIWERYKHIPSFARNKKGNSGTTYLGRLLKDRTYLGQNKHYKYPAILDEGLFNEVNERLADKKFIKTNLSAVFYAQGLVKINGLVLSPNSAKANYFKVIDGRNYSINANLIDDLAFNNACVILSLQNESNSKERLENAKKQVEVCKVKAESIKDEIAKRENAKDRLTSLYIDGRISETKYNFEADRIEGELAHLLTEQDDNNKTMIQLENIINNTDNKMLANVSYNSLSAISDDLERQRLVREAIDYIDIKPIGESEYEIRFIYKDKSFIKGDYYLYKRNGCKINLYNVYDDICEDLSGTWSKRLKTSEQRKRQS